MMLQRERTPEGAAVGGSICFECFQPTGGIRSSFAARRRTCPAVERPAAELEPEHRRRRPDTGALQYDQSVRLSPGRSATAPSSPQDLPRQHSSVPMKLRANDAFTYKGRRGLQPHPYRRMRS
jgi:hypothetical protein